MSIRYLDFSGAVNFWTNIKNFVLSKIPTKTSELTNDSGFLTQHQSLSNYVTLNSEQTITGKKLFTNTTTKVNSVNTFTGSTQFIDLSTTVPRGEFPESAHRVGRVYIGDNSSYNGAWFVIDPTIDTDKVYYRMVTTNPDNSDSTRFTIEWNSNYEGARRRRNISMGDLIPYSTGVYNLGGTSNAWQDAYINNVHGISDYTNFLVKVLNYTTTLTHAVSGRRTVVCEGDITLTLPTPEEGSWFHIKATTGRVILNFANGVSVSGVDGIPITLKPNESILLCYYTASSYVAFCNFKRCGVIGRTGTAPSEPKNWFKVAECTLTETYIDPFICLRVFESTTGNTIGTLCAHCRINNTVGVVDTSNCYLQWQDAGAGIDLSKYALTTNETSGTGVTITLWCTLVGGYSSLKFEVVTECKRNDYPNNNTWKITRDRQTDGDLAELLDTDFTKIVYSTLTTLKNDTTGNAKNVTGTVAIANGGTGATSRLSAIKNLTNESVGTPTHFLGLTTNYAKCGYTSIAQAKTVLGITGDMGSHSNSEYVHKTGDESISGDKTFTNNITLSGTYLGTEASTNERTNIYLLANRDTAGASGAYIGRFRQNRTQGAMEQTDVSFITFDFLENSTRYTRCFTMGLTDWDSNGVPQTYYLTSPGGKGSLGTVSNLWNKVYATNYYYGANNTEFSTKFVTSDTTQTISGAKTFSSTITGDLTGTASKATGDANGREISTGYMWRGSYERIVGTNEEHKDLNTYQNAGFYNVKTALVDNCPSGIGVDAVLLVYPWDHGNYPTQEITEAAASSNARRWIRKCNNGTWSDWKRIAFTTDDISGNASTATQFSANKDVTLTGDVTGTASSKAGWSVSTTLSNSGVTAGTYGPSEDVTGNNNATISVPEITVDSKGRVTSVTNRTLKCKNNTYNVYNKTLTIQKNGTNVATFTSNSNTNVTANITVPTKTSELTNDSNFLTTSSSLNASKLTGTIDIARLPQGALERVITVANQTARFALTTSSVQLGDTVKQLDTGVMYVVVNESKLNSNDGYLEYTAGSASSVPWSGITSKPTEFTPSSHTHTKSEITDFPTNVSAFTNDSGYLTSHQSLSNYVTLNTAQEITNTKTFKDANTVRKLTSVEAGNVIPTSDKLISDIWLDKNGKELGRIYFSKTKGGNTALIMRAGDWFTSNEGVYTLDASGTNRRAEIHLYSDASGNCCIKPVGYFSTTLKPLNSSVLLGEYGNSFGSVYANQFRMSNPSLEPNVDVSENEEHSVGFFGKNNTPLSYITFQKRINLKDRIAVRIQTAPGSYISYDFDAEAFYPESSNGTQSIGTSTNRFNNCYCNNYYLGSTAFGDIVTHNASEFLTHHPSITLNTNTTSTASPAHGGTFTCIDSVTQDTNGHITKVNTKTVTLPSDNNTDTKVKQYEGTTNQERPILSRYNSTEASQTANFVVYDTGVTSNPAKHTITASGGFIGNASSATEFKDSKSVTLTGDVTGTVSSKAGWTVSTTLANSGVTAGTYGPSADVTGSNNATISVPEITVDAKGRVTAVTNRTYTSVNTDSDKKVYQYYKSDDNVYRLLFSNNAGNTATSNVGAVYSGLNNSFYVNPSTGSLYATKLYSNGVEVLTSHQSLSSCVKNSVTNTQTIKSTAITRGTAPSSAQAFGLGFSDNNDKYIGNIYGQYATDKSTYVGLYAYKGTTTANGDNASVKVGYDASGNVYTSAPTPATADNSTQIATTAFVKAQGYLTSHQSLANYVTTNTDQSISGIKSHSKHISILGDYVGNESSTNSRSCLYLKANRDTDGKSGLYVTKFRQNVAQGSMGSSDVVFLSHDILENETRTNAGFVESYSNWANDVPGGVSIYSTIATRNLGTSAKPWTNAYAVNIYENGTALSSKYALNENFGKGTTTYLYIKSADFPTGSGSTASIQYNDVVDGTKLYVWYSVCNSSSILDIHPTATKVTSVTGQVWRYLGPTIYAGGLGHQGASPTGILGLFRRES